MANAVLTMRVYTAPGVWTKPDGLIAVDVLVRGAGGSGNADTGGGGGAAVQLLRVKSSEFDDTLSVEVGTGGSAGGDGGHSSFGPIYAPGGLGGNNGGTGGIVSGMRGGSGGAPGQPGESITSGIVRLLAAGGGGAGSGSTGGKSGFVNAGVSNPPLWQWCQSGGGGNANQDGGFPSGGGGTNANGANGCVVILEYTKESI